MDALNATDIHDQNIFAIPLGACRIDHPAVAFVLAPDIEVRFEPGKVKVTALAPYLVADDRTDGIPRIARDRRAARTLWSAGLPSKPPFTAPTAASEEDPAGTERVLRRWWSRQAERFVPTCRCGTIALYEELVRTLVEFAGAPLHALHIKGSGGASTPEVVFNSVFKGSAALHRLLTALTRTVHPTGLRAHQGGACFEDIGLRPISFGQPGANLDKPASAHRRMKLLGQASRLLDDLAAAPQPAPPKDVDQMRGLLKDLAATLR